MRGWRGQLRRASFRGASFFVEEFGGEYGRRWADHEYPGRNTPFAEDLGRSQRVWRINGYTLGDFYIIERDRLLAACQMAGAGELIHPTIGAVQAVCRSVVFNEERDRGRMCGFTFEFAEAGSLQEPADATDQNLACEFAADGLGEIAPMSFAESFSVAGGGPWVADAAAGDVQNLAAGLNQMRLPASGYPQGPLVANTAYLAANASSLVGSPALLGEQVNSSFAAFTDAGDALPVVGAMLHVATEWNAGAPSGSGGFTLVYFSQTAPRVTGRVPKRTGSVSTLLRAANAAVFERFVRQLALREVGYAVTGLTLDNYDEAIAMRDKIAAAFITVEHAAADAGEDRVFEALAGLRAAITRMIHARAANLNPLVTYRTLSTVNSLALAWRLYQDSDRDIDLAVRTAARNPAFLPRTGRVLAAPLLSPGAGSVHARGRL